MVIRMIRSSIYVSLTIYGFDPPVTLCDQVPTGWGFRGPGGPQGGSRGAFFRVFFSHAFFLRISSPVGAFFFSRFSVFF